MTTPAPPITTITLTLSRKTTRYALESLQMLENKWLEINHTSTDEDEQADYGNDALDLHGTRESIQSQAVEAFGPPASPIFRVNRFPRPPHRTAIIRDHGKQNSVSVLIVDPPNVVTQSRSPKSVAILGSVRAASGFALR